MASSWSVALYLVFNHWNARKDYYLFRQWMSLTQEIPPKSNPNYRLVGLSAEENAKFWQTEDLINRIIYRLANCFLLFFSIIASGLLFIVRFEKVNLWFYLFMQTINVLHVACFFFCFYHSIYMVNILYISVVRILTKKFHAIAARAAQCNAARFKVVNNRRLFRLLYEHNRVSLELLEMNAFFCNFVGVNLVHLFGFVVLVSDLFLFYSPLTTFHYLQKNNSSSANASFKCSLL